MGRAREHGYEVQRQPKIRPFVTSAVSGKETLTKTSGVSPDLKFQEASFATFGSGTHRLWALGKWAVSHGISPVRVSPSGCLGSSRLQPAGAGWYTAHRLSSAQPLDITLGTLRVTTGNGLTTTSTILLVVTILFSSWGIQIPESGAVTRRGCSRETPTAAT
jgi:hypothetical protein